MIRMIRPLIRSRILVSVLLASVLGVLLPALLAQDAHAQDFAARVDRTRLSENETLSLEVVYAERADTSAIDFEALLPDFEILSIRPSSQTRIINFKRSSQTSWQLTLMPRRLGALRIPAFQIDSARTRPIDIQVTAAPTRPEQGAPFAAEIAPDREQAFVNEQILVRITLSASREVSDLRGEPLEVEDAETTLISQSEFQRVVGSEPYRVTELVYAVFPRKPGALTLPSIRYQGTLRRTQLVVSRTPPVSIEILDPSLDADASQHTPWFPAGGVALSREWSSDPRALVVGEPVTRSVRVTAAGQHAAAIAPLAAPDGRFKYYPEKASIEDSETSSGILGTRDEAAVFVPTEPGEIRLPPIEIDWWNTSEQRWESARLPGETLHVVPDASASPTPSPPQGPPAPLAEVAPAEPTDPRDASGRGGLGSARLDDSVTLALAGVCAVLAATCLVLYRRVRRLEAGVSGGGDRAGSVPDGNEAKAFERVMKSLTAANAAHARRDVLAWARARWPESRVAGLDDLARLADDDALARGLEGLDAALYRRPERRPERRPDGGQDSETGVEVDFDLLAERLERLRASSVEPERAPEGALTELYPTGRISSR